MPKRASVYHLSSNFEREAEQMLAELSELARKGLLKGFVIAWETDRGAVRFRAGGTMRAKRELGHSAADRLKAMIRDTFEDE